VFVKVCGITRLEDAEAAVECGARALGFVFWPDSPRFIDPLRAREITAVLPPFVTPVGVFVNQPAGHVNEIAMRVGLGVVQLHGDESVAYAATITRPVLKAMTLADAETDAIGQWPTSTMVLLDAHDPERRGGTGTRIDWLKAASVAEWRPIMLAGGLNATNVMEAVRRVQPFGIDVSSGVESSPGVKDAARLKTFFEAVNAVHVPVRTQWRER